MPPRDFEFVIVCKQEQSELVIKELKDSGKAFELQGERGFAPVSSEVAVTILIGLAEWLPIIVDVCRRLWRRQNAYVDIETRHRLARRMLADIGPLYLLKGEDTPKYSYYEFKTSKCKHYWEMNEGEIRYGPLGCK